MFLNKTFYSIEFADVHLPCMSTALQLTPNEYVCVWVIRLWCTRPQLWYKKQRNKKKIYSFWKRPEIKEWQTINNLIVFFTKFIVSYTKLTVFNRLPEIFKPIVPATRLIEILSLEYIGKRNESFWNNTRFLARTTTTQFKREFIFILRAKKNLHILHENRIVELRYLLRIIQERWK